MTSREGPRMLLTFFQGGAVGGAMIKVLFTSALLLASCASMKPLVFAPSAITPAATGTVERLAAPNGNTRLLISVANLAPPSRVGAGATSYVVWATEISSDSSRTMSPRNIGALQVDKKLSATLETLTPLRDFDLMITAEALATAEVPSGAPVLSLRVAAP